MPLAKRADWFGGIARILQFTRKPSTYAQHLRARMKICCSLWSQGHIGLLLWMDVIKMHDIRAMAVPCPYCRSAFGGWGWSAWCHNPSEPAHAVYSMSVACPRPLYTPSWLLLPWISYMLTSPAWRPLWRQTSHLELLMSWYSKTTSQNTILAYVTPNQMAKTIAKFLYQGYISIFEAQPDSWVTKVLTSWVVWLMECARSLAWRSCRLCYTTHRLMGW